MTKWNINHLISVFFIILALKQHQTRNVSWARVFTSWPGFVCLYVTETDRPTDRESWMSVGVGASINTESMEAHGLSDPNVNFRGGIAEATAEARGQHSCSWQTMHSFAQSTERRQSPQGAHMSQHALHKPSCYSLSCSIFYPHKQTHVQLI